MSRSLTRIRSLVSEIEQIQRKGQQGGIEALERSVNLKPAPISIHQEATPVIEEEQDPFQDLADLVELDTRRPNARVHMELSSQVTLSLQMENSDERVELRQVGESIEILFQDGKAFHLPLKAVV